MAAKTTKITCPQCKRSLPREAFGNDKTRKSGVYRICKECDAANQKAWRDKQKAKNAGKATAKAPAKKAVVKKATPKRAPRKRTVKATPTPETTQA